MRSSPSLKLVRVLHHSYRSLYFNLLLLHFILCVSPLSSSSTPSPSVDNSQSPHRLSSRSLSSTPDSDQSSPDSKHPLSIRNLILASLQNSESTSPSTSTSYKPSPTANNPQNDSSHVIPQSDSVPGTINIQDPSNKLSGNSHHHPNTSTNSAGNPTLQSNSDSNHTTKANSELSDQSSITPSSVDSNHQDPTKLLPAPQTKQTLDRPELGKDKRNASLQSSSNDVDPLPHNTSISLNSIPDSNSKTDLPGQTDHKPSQEPSTYSPLTDSNTPSDSHDRSINKSATTLKAQSIEQPLSDDTPSISSTESNSSTLAGPSNKPFKPSSDPPYPSDNPSKPADVSNSNPASQSALTSQNASKAATPSPLSPEPLASSASASPNPTSSVLPPDSNSSSQASNNQLDADNQTAPLAINKSNPSSPPQPGTNNNSVLPLTPSDPNNPNNNNNKSNSGLVDSLHLDPNKSAISTQPASQDGNSQQNSNSQPSPLDPNNSLASAKPVSNLSTVAPLTTTASPEGSHNTKDSNSQSFPLDPNQSLVSPNLVSNLSIAGLTKNKGDLSSGNLSTITPSTTTTSSKDSNSQSFPLDPNQSLVSPNLVSNFSIAGLTRNKGDLSSGNLSTITPSTTTTSSKDPNSQAFPLDPNQSFVSTNPISNLSATAPSPPAKPANKDNTNLEPFPLDLNNSVAATNPIANFSSLTTPSKDSPQAQSSTNPFPINLNDSVVSTGLKPFTFDRTQPINSAQNLTNQTGSLSGTSAASSALTPVLTGGNLTSVSVPFKLSGSGPATSPSLKPNNSQEAFPFSSPESNNLTVVSSPFIYNESHSVNPLPLVSTPSTSNSSLSTPVSSQTNDSFPLQAGGNSTLVSAPFKYDSSGKPAPPTVLNQINANLQGNGSASALNLTGGFPSLTSNETMVSTPFKDPTKTGNSNGTLITPGTLPLQSPSNQQSPNTFPFSDHNNSSTFSTNITLAGNNASSTQSNNNNNNNYTSFRGDQKPAPAYVPLATLFVNPHQADGSSKSTTPPQPLETPLPSAGTPPKKDSPAPFPSSWPRYIVPLNEPTSPPANSTLISILFTDALNWPWLVTNSNASTQVLVFMPILISSALQIPEDEVVTQSLQAYQPANFDSDNQARMLAIWLGYIPGQYVGELQAMIHAPQSRFYSDPNPVLRALAKTVDPTLPISTFEKKTPASQAAAKGNSNNNDNGPPANQGQKIAVIASITTCGAAILAIGLVILARQSRRRVGPQHKHGTTGPYGLRIGAPMIGSFQRGLDGLPVPNRPMEQLPGVPVTGLAGHGLHPNSPPRLKTPESDSAVRYEFGQARTTSEAEYPSVGGHSPSHRTSWWGRMSGMLNRPEDTHGRTSHDSPGLDSRTQPPRRVQITRGADGLVSGIGRPVLKENSLFF